MLCSSVNKGKTGNDIQSDEGTDSLWKGVSSVLPRLCFLAPVPLAKPSGIRFKVAAIFVQNNLYAGEALCKAVQTSRGKRVLKSLRHDS